MEIASTTFFIRQNIARPSLIIQLIEYFPLPFYESHHDKKTFRFQIFIPSVTILAIF